MGRVCRGLIMSPNAFMCLVRFTYRGSFGRGFVGIFIFYLTHYTPFFPFSYSDFCSSEVCQQDRDDGD